MSVVNQEIDFQDRIKAIFLTAEDLKIAGSILYQAYHDDPFFLDIFEVEKEGYESRLRSAIREELNTFWSSNQPMIGLFEEERLLAVACLISPNSTFGPERSWHWRLKMMLTAGSLGTNQLVEKEQKVRDHMPRETYHLLTFIGVHPDHQHRGLGHVLMRAIDSVMQEAPESEGVGVYVTLPRCLSFFADGDYEMVKELEVAHITGQIMFRPRPEENK